MSERIPESAVVVVVATLVTVFVTALPVLAGILVPYTNFSAGEGVRILRIEAVFILFFAVVFLGRGLLRAEREYDEQ